MTLSPFIGALGRYSKNDYFIEGGLDVGWGVQSQNYELDGVEKKETTDSIFVAFLSSAGKWIPGYGVVGASMNVEGTSTAAENSQFFISDVEISLSYRIDF